MSVFHEVSLAKLNLIFDNNFAKKILVLFNLHANQPTAKGDLWTT